MIKCPSCGHKNKDNTKFCPECGFKSAASKNSSSLPSEFSVASSGAAIESEHGNVIKYEGDCIMASFGISESNELDPSYSCYAALKMQRELSNFSEVLKKARGFELKMRIGIHTGRAVVGLIGGRLDIMGDAVNIAARMEPNAGIGKIMITSDMAKQLKGRFLLERLEPVNVKGKDEPIQVYNVIDKSEIRSRLILERRTEMGSGVKMIEASAKAAYPSLLATLYENWGVFYIYKERRIC